MQNRCKQLVNNTSIAPDMRQVHPMDQSNCHKRSHVPELMSEECSRCRETEKPDVTDDSHSHNPDVNSKLRGRPKDSRNKANRPPSGSTYHRSHSCGSFNFHLLVIEHGHFVIRSLAKQARTFLQSGGGLLVVGAQGRVAHITLEDAQRNGRALLGAYNIVSFSGQLGGTESRKFSITLSGPSLQPYGGLVFGDFQPLSSSIVVQVISSTGPPLMM